MAAGKSGVVASRACGRCKRPLSRYNDGDYCAGCSTVEARESVPGAESAAVAEVGVRLRSVRLRRGMNLTVLAGRSGCRRRICRWWRMASAILTVTR